MRTLPLLLLLTVLTACGGGDGASNFASGGTGSTGGAGGTGGTGGSGSGGSGSGSPYTAGVFPASASFAAKCASPRVGTDPNNGNRTFADTQGTATDENNFLRSWTNELYLWFDEVPDLNPAGTATPDYFNLLKTSATTQPSGAAKDKFHFTYPTSTWEQLSQAGVSVGYGVVFVINNEVSPRTVTAAYVQAGAPGATANIVRGTTVVSIDGVSVTANDQASINTLNAGLTPASQDEQHTFVVQDPGSATTRSANLVATTVTETTVPVTTTFNAGSGKVGYLLFNDHLATSEQELFNAFTTLRNANVTDLVLDIRYNGGGYLDIASEVAYMIAGTAQTAGRKFYQQQFNSKNTSTNPVTKTALTPVDFHTVTQGLAPGFAPNQVLPSLNLPRVFVLTGADTCSASEAIVNSLRGVGVNVIQIGSTTCGKPYGFYPQDNCGTTYFSIQFKGINDMNFGDYPDGFTPSNATTAAGVSVNGCSVADDFSHNLGDPAEGLLGVAISYSANPVCSVAPSGFSQATVKRANRQGFPTELHAKSPFRENMIFRH